MADELLSSFSRERIARLAEDALRRADVVNVLPTPMEAVQQAVGIDEVIDISSEKLPSAVEAKKPSKWKRVLGAWVYGERIAYVDRGEASVRVHFTDAHEATHAMCPWHGPTLQVDDEDSLMGRLRKTVESEANYGAGHLIFQGGRFHRRALEEQVSIRTPLDFAREYGASKHATLHYYVEEHPDALALLVAGRFPRWNGTLPIWRTVESAEFLRRFGELSNHLPGEGLSTLEEGTSPLPLADIVNASSHAIDPPTKELHLVDRGGSPRRFVAEAFFNGRCYFVLLTDRKARRLGRRVRLANAS
jgi:hypothetical protein